MNKRPTQESLDLANKFICEMEGGAPNLTSTDFSNAKKLAALLDSIRLEEAKWWAGGMHPRTVAGEHYQEGCGLCERIEALEMGAGGSTKS